MYVMYVQEWMAKDLNGAQGDSTGQASKTHNTGGNLQQQMAAPDPRLANSGKSESTWNLISKQIKQLTDKVAKGAQKIAFNIGVYGVTVDIYAKSLLEMFRETYFIENWIQELESL